MTETAPATTTGIGARCTEMTRTSRGWEMCHRTQHHPTEPHHVRDREWYTDGGPTPRLRIGATCAETCGWPDYVMAYLGVAPRTESGGPKSYVRQPTRARPRRA